MFEFIGGVIAGAGFIYLVNVARRRQMVSRLDQTIAADEERLSGGKLSSTQRAELSERLDIMQRARAGRVPIDPQQRTKVAVSILPSLALLIALIVFWVQNDQTTSSYLLFGLGIGALGAQITMRTQTLLWRPEADPQVTP